MSDTATFHRQPVAQVWALARRSVLATLRQPPVWFPSVLFPLLLAVAGVLSWRHRTWRPVCLAAFTFVSLNLVVGAMKVLIGRAETETGSVDVFSGGVIFPSGHSSNMVLTGGLTCATSIYIGSHWVSDLIAGILVGGLLLQAVIVFDRATVRARLLRERRIAGMILEPGPVLRLGRLQGDRHGVDAVAVPRRRLGGVVEDVPEVRPATTAPHLRAPHEQ